MMSLAFTIIGMSTLEMKMSKLDKALGALRAVVKGIPEEMIDTHIRNLLDFCERTIKEIEED